MRAVVAFTVVLALVVAFGSSGAGASKAPQKAQASDDCMTDPLGPVPDWNIVVMGDLNLMNTDSEGRMVIGRDATLQNFGVASSYPNDASRIDLAVGRDLNAVSTGINHGSATYGRDLFGTLTNPLPNGTITRATTPFDVGALFEALAIRSSAWAELDPNGTISGPQYGALTLEGTNPTRNVFTLSASTARLGAGDPHQRAVRLDDADQRDGETRVVLEQHRERDRVLGRVGLRPAAEPRPVPRARGAADEDGVELARRNRR